ncbi:hypothetical protein NECAME_12910, partial [Necator americanus]
CSNFTSAFFLSTKAGGGENGTRTSTPILRADSQISSMAVTRSCRSPISSRDSAGGLSNRRKQNLNAITDMEDNVTIVYENAKYWYLSPTSYRLSDNNIFCIISFAEKTL